MQFSAAIFPHIIRFISSTNPRAIVSWLSLYVSSSLDIKKRNRISERGNPYRIPVGIGINSLSYPSIIIFVIRPIRNTWTNFIIQSSRPLFLRIYRSLSCNTLSKAPLRSRLSMDTVHPGWAYHTAWTLDVIMERAKRVDRFFLAPICVHGSSSYASAASYIRSVTIFSRSFPRVFSLKLYIRL